MKKIIVLLAFSCITNLLPAQSNKQQKTDSVCGLVKKYFNEKNVGQLYELTGESFKKELSADAFKNVCDQIYFRWVKSKKLFSKTIQMV